MKRLHTEENNRQTSNLSANITSAAGALDLLRVLGFHFQAKGATLKDPYVVYPHWNKDDLLIPTYDALRAVQGKHNKLQSNLNNSNLDGLFIMANSNFCF